MIDFDFEMGPLEIRTDNVAGDMVAFRFHTEKETAGSISFNSDAPGYYSYYLEKCTGWRNFPKSILDSRYKIWRVDLIRTPDVRIVIHCNNTELLNFLMSDSSCTESWEDWSKRVVKIQFLPNDIASVGFRTYTGKSQVFVANFFSLHYFVSVTRDDFNDLQCFGLCSSAEKGR